MNALHHSARIASYVVLIVPLIASAPKALACLNEYEERKESYPERQDRVRRAGVAEYMGRLTSAKSEGPTDERLEELRIAAEERDYRRRSDYAVVLARRGDAAQALEIFKALEKEHPDDYVIAANLGTAFELTGDDAQALVWITTALRLNPQSHQGTEWLHVEILQAKLAMAKEPGWLSSHSVLGLDFGQRTWPTRPAKPAIDLDGEAKALADVRAALEYQLHERLGLVEPPDAVVADLLTDLGNLLVLDGEHDNALAVYRLASGYSPGGLPLLYGRIQAVKSSLEQSAIPTRVMLGCLFVGLLIGAGALGVAIKRWLPYELGGSFRPGDALPPPVEKPSLATNSTPADPIEPNGVAEHQCVEDQLGPAPAPVERV